MEQWKTIPGFTRYQASSTGKLRSTNYKNSKKTKILKPALDRRGYLKTMLQNDDGKYCSWTVHKFITLTFYGEMEFDYTVDHIDGNKENNCINNLEYVTRSENCKRAVKLGLWEVRRGDKNGMAKLTWDQVKEARDAKAKGGRYWGRNEMAEKLGISKKHLQKIVNKSSLW